MDHATDPDPYAGYGEDALYHDLIRTQLETPPGTQVMYSNYGGGLRYFFDVEKGLSVRLDYGVGQKPVGEQRESGFYIGLGQAF